MIARTPNPMSGLRAFIIREIGFADSWLPVSMASDERVFVGGLPKRYSEGVGSEVYPHININPVPGLMSGHEAPFSSIRVQVMCAAGDFDDAGNIDLAVYSLLKPLRGTVVYFTGAGGSQSVYIYSAWTGNPYYYRDPDVAAALVTRDYVIRFGERSTFPG